MKKLLLALVVVVVAGGAGYAGGLFAPHQAAPQAYGGFNPTGGGTYYLQASISASQTTITLSSFTEPGSGTPYTMAYLNSDIMYGTLAPQTDTNEFISFTGINQNANGTATLTGVTRGLGRSYPYTASSTLANPFPGQTRFILSSPPEFYNEYATKRNDQQISGVWGFLALPTSSVPCTNNVQFCNKAYIDAGLNQGAATSTEDNLGLVQLATNAQVGIGTASSTAGGPLVISNKFATTTPGTLCTGGTWNCLVAAASGKIAHAFLNLADSFTWTGTQIFTASTTVAATSSVQATVATPFIINGVPFKFPLTYMASGTIPTNNGSGTLAGLAPTYQFLGATSTTFASKYATTSISSTAKNLHIVVFVPSSSTNQNIMLQFNSDAASNYGYRYYTNLAGLSAVGSQTQLFLSNGTTTAQTYSIDVSNIATSRKLLTWTGSVQANAGAVFPDLITGTGIWSNTSAQISSVVLGINGSETLGIGTVVQVYGLND